MCGQKLWQKVRCVTREFRLLRGRCEADMTKSLFFDHPP